MTDKLVERLKFAVHVLKVSGYPDEGEDVDEAIAALSTPTGEEVIALCGDLSDCIDNQDAWAGDGESIVIGNGPNVMRKSRDLLQRLDRERQAYERNAIHHENERCKVEDQLDLVTEQRDAYEKLARDWNDELRRQYGPVRYADDIEHALNRIRAMTERGEEK